VTLLETRCVEAFAVLRAADRVVGGAVLPRWLDADRFWYRHGDEVRIVTCSDGTFEAGQAPSACEPELRAEGGNLWFRDRPLTNDGADDNAYGVRPLAWRRFAGDRSPEALWSPDASRLLTVQVDERHVPGGISTPGDPRVTELRVLSIDVATGRQVEARYPRLTSTRMNDTPMSANLAWWGADSRVAYFVDVERHERSAYVVAFDVETGATRVVFSEHAEMRIDLGPNVYEPTPMRALQETKELVWWSERSGFGHLYVYDLETGACKRQLTSGEWQVRDVLHVDQDRRDVLFLAAGLAAGDDPYTCRPCLVALDGGEPSVVSEEPGDHVIWKPGAWGLEEAGVSGVSPDGGYFVETVGRVNAFPRTVLRRRDGDEVAVLEVAEDDGLPSTWTWPEPFTAKAADGATETYGLLFRPPGYDPADSYPVIDVVYGGPQLSWVPKSAFAHGGFGPDRQLLEAAHLASLGAFVLILDGRGTGGRERAFRLASYGTVRAPNLEDQVAALHQLAACEPAVDLDRVAVCGFSAGGNSAVHAILRFPDVFHVAVAGGGAYDLRLFWHTWGERYVGPYDAELYDAQAAKTYASRLDGKLLLIHGLEDSVCPPQMTFDLLDAFIAAGKDVDLVIEPSEGHDFGDHALRRRLAFLTTHLFPSD
jgi:dipeptidyl aminopeptidase/acylaminoacyl peptidase